MGSGESRFINSSIVQTDDVSQLSAITTKPITRHHAERKRVPISQHDCSGSGLFRRASIPRARDRAHRRARGRCGPCRSRGCRERIEDVLSRAARATMRSARSMRSCWDTVERPLPAASASSVTHHSPSARRSRSFSRETSAAVRKRAAARSNASSLTRFLRRFRRACSSGPHVGAGGGSPSSPSRSATLWEVASRVKGFCAWSARR